MIAALIAILLLGGGVENAVLDYVGFMRSSVDEVVVDEERRADALATIQQMKKLTGSHSKSNQSAFKSLLAEMSKMETDTESVDALWGDYYEAVEAYNEQMVDLRFKLRDSLTREEWERIFASSGG